MAMITAMSTRGQIVLPVAIRKALKLAVGAKFVVFNDGDNILLKPIKEPRLSDFEKVMSEAREWAHEVGLEEGEIGAAIKAVRRRRHENRH